MGSHTARFDLEGDHDEYDGGVVEMRTRGLAR